MLDVGALTDTILWGATGKARLFYALAMLSGALLVAAFLIRRVDRWRKKQADEQYSPGDQLTEFRDMYEAGEISKEEFDQIRRRLGGMLREELLEKESVKPADQTDPSGEDKPPSDWSIQVDKPDS